MDSTKVKLLSLFSGAGGLDLGFQRSNYDIVWANDNNIHVAKTYQSFFTI